MFSIVARFYDAISAYRKPWIIAFSMASGLTLVLIPGATLLWFLFFVPLMLVRINQVALIGTMVLGRIFVKLIDPYTERLGYYLLTRDFLYEPMGRFLSVPFVGWLRLDDSFVFGGLLVGIIGWPLFFLLFLLIVRLYRKFVAPRMKAVFRFLSVKLFPFGRRGKRLAETGTVDRHLLDNEKKIQIPLYYHKPLSKRRYRAMLKTLSDRAELGLLESVFSLGKDGKYHYQDPLDRKTAESAAVLLRRIHRTKSGPRMARIVFVALIIGLPILFNILFLDKLAARQLEVFLASLSQTDVTVEGLDIAPLAGRISLHRLGFASKSDPMLDRWQMQGIVSDISWSSLSFRRLVFEELRGTGAIDVARKTPALYPTTKARVKPPRGDAGKFSGMDWIPSDVIPHEAVELVKSLRKTYESKYDSWTLRVEGDIASVRSLSERVESLITEPMPETVAGWITRVEEGRSVAAEINSSLNLLDAYKRDLSATLREAESTFERVRTAVEHDLTLIEKTFRLDGEILDRWLQSAIEELAGPRLGAVYRQVVSNSALTGLLRREQNETKSKSERRMKQGRIIQFPVRLPPRFSIETLSIGGEGVRVVGENIGIDHDLAGAPSHLLVELDELAGLDELAADITVDGRTGTDNVFLGKVDFSGWDWLINYEDVNGVKSSIGGLIGASTTVSVLRAEDANLEMVGLARLTDWETSNGESILSFVRESSPPLGFQFEARFSEKKPEFKISVVKEYLQDWIALLSDTLLREGKERARQLLLDEVGTDLEDFEALLVDWNEQGELLDVTLEQLTAQSVNLKENITEWTKQTTGELVPSSELLEGLKSLF